MSGDTVSPVAVEEATIDEIHAAYRAGRATARSVTQAHLDRIAAYDRKGPALGAIIITNPQALSDAAALDVVISCSNTKFRGGLTQCVEPTMSSAGSFSEFIASSKNRIKIFTNLRIDLARQFCSPAAR